MERSISVCEGSDQLVGHRKWNGRTQPLGRVQHTQVEKCRGRSANHYALTSPSPGSLFGKLSYINEVRGRG